MSLPEPLVYSSCDCTDLDGFMLNVERLMASELVALGTHEEVAAAMFLWCRAWKQTPAASLPDDDRVNAAFARLPLTRFKKFKANIMHGFVKCSDGRLYHRFLAAEAERAFERKDAFRRKRESDAKRLNEWRKKQRETHNETHNETPVETRFVAEGQGQGQVVSKKEDNLLAQQPVPGASAVALSKSDCDKLEHDLREAAGLANCPHPGLCDLSPILGLFDQGADLQREILPSIRAKPNNKARSWCYFVPQIQEFRAKLKASAVAPFPDVKSGERRGYVRQVGAI